MHGSSLNPMTTSRPMCWGDFSGLASNAMVKAAMLECKVYILCYHGVKSLGMRLLVRKSGIATPLTKQRSLGASIARHGNLLSSNSEEQACFLSVSVAGLENLYVLSHSGEMES